MNFDSTVLHFLAEMPWIEIPLADGETSFDLQLEEYKDTPDMLLRMFEQIFRGEAVQDKYGTIIQLENNAEKSALIDILIQNEFFASFCQKFYGTTLLSFLSKIPDFMNFAPSRATRVDERSKASKSSVEYQAGPKNRQRCDECTMWVSPSKCTAVAGSIEAGGWCTWWKKKLVS